MLFLKLHNKKYLDGKSLTDEKETLPFTFIKESYIRQSPSNNQFDTTKSPKLFRYFHDINPILNQSHKGLDTVSL